MSRSMRADEWLRAITVWCPFTERPPGTPLCPFPPEVHIRVIAEALAKAFPPEAFNEVTVKLAAQQCETFPNYGRCCHLLRGAGYPRTARRS